MRSGLNLLHGLVGLTTVFALTACGDDGGATGTGGSGSGGSDGTGGSAAQGSPTSTVTGTTGTSPVGPATTSTGSGNCVAEVFADPDVNSCGEENCCEEMQTCLADPASCFNAETNTLDDTLPNGEALATCMTEADCFGSGDFAIFCDSGIGYDLSLIEDPETAAEIEEFVGCFNDSGCCEFFDICTDGGTDTDGCLDCLNGAADDYSRCEDANACAISACGDSLVFVPTCDSGLGTGSIEVGTCLTDNCCDDYNACTGGPYTDAELETQEAQDAIQACLDCLNAENGGDLCNAAIECGDTNCNTAICESGVTIDDIDLAECLSTNCCDEYTDCTGGDPEDTEAVEACITCFNEYDPEGSEAPGELCAPAIECEDTFCAGGEGGGGTGGGGTGGAPGTGGGGGAGGA